MTQPPRPGTRTRSGLPPGPGPLLPFAEELPPSSRHRTLVIHFPDLACELAIFARESRVGVAGALGLDRPLAAVLLEDGEVFSEDAPIHSATAAARRAGVRPGQRVADARRLVPSLDARGVELSRVEAALRGFGEMLYGVGNRHRVLRPDSILVDLPREPLAGTEGPLVAHVCERLRMLGHRVRAAVSEQEAVSLLLARFGPDPRVVVAPGREREMLAPFPGELLQRVEQSLRQHPGVPFQPSSLLVEEVAWEEGVSGTEPLQFALHWLVARLAARLVGRHQEAQIARLFLVLSDGQERCLQPQLRTPVRRAADLLQAFRFRIDELASDDSARALRMVLDGLATLSEEGGPVSVGQGALQSLVLELAAELGPGRVGLLSHQEGSALPRLQEPPSLQVSLWPADALAPPTRVLDVPTVVSGKIARGSRVEIDHQTFVVQRVTPVEVRHGTPNPGLDHLLVWLTHGDSGALSWITRDRRLKRALLHGWFT